MATSIAVAAPALSSCMHATRQPIEVAIEQLLDDPLQALLPVCKLIEGWSEVDEKSLTVEQLSGAMTNLVYRATHTQRDRELLAIVRIFGGCDGLFARDDERNIFRLVSDLGLGPTLLVDFENGRAEEFWGGHSISAQHMAQPWVAATIASAMSTFHWYGPVLADAPGAPHLGATVWDRVSEWHALVRRYWGDRYAGFDLAAMEQQVEQLMTVLTTNLPPWIAFCHNDLQYGNMMMFDRHVGRGGEAQQCASEQQISTRKREKKVRSNANLEALAPSQRSTMAPQVRFIDYEYASFNHIGFDIANHWCEYAADYHSDAPHQLDFSRFPSPFAQSTFCQAYVRKMVKLRRHHKMKRVDGPGLPGAPPAPRVLAGSLQRSRSLTNMVRSASDKGGGERGLALERAGSLADLAISSLAGMVQDCRDEHDIDSLAERLRCAALCYVPVSHLHWGLWGLIQARQSKVDFQFEAYAQQRLLQYAQHVADVLAGRLPICGQLLVS